MERELLPVKGVKLTILQFNFGIWSSILTRLLVFIFTSLVTQFVVSVYHYVYIVI
jgi:hypothetical protein